MSQINLTVKNAETEGWKKYTRIYLAQKPNERPIQDQESQSQEIRVIPGFPIDEKNKFQEL